MINNHHWEVGVTIDMLHCLPQTALSDDIRILLQHPQRSTRFVVWPLSAKPGCVVCVTWICYTL